MNKLLEAQNILIIPDKRLDIDLIAASISLAEVLKDRGKDVSLLVDQTNYPKFVEKIFPRRGIEIFNVGRTKEYVLTLADQKAKVEDIDWTQDKERIMLIITTETGDIVQGRTKIERATGIFDQVIMIGAREPQETGSFYRENKELFEEDKLVQIKHEKNIAKQTHTSIFSNSLSENVFEFMLENNLKISKYVATYLLTGIYWKTSGFTENIRSSKIIENVKKLVDLGGDIFVAVRKALQNLTEEQAKFIGESLSKLVIDKDGIGVSIIKSDSSRKLNFNHMIFKKWDIVRYAGKAKAVIMLIQKDKIVQGFLFSNSKKIDAYESVKNLKAQGNFEKAVFTSNRMITDTLEEIQKNIRKQLGIGLQEDPIIKSNEQNKTPISKAQIPNQSNQNEDPVKNDFEERMKKDVQVEAPKKFKKIEDRPAVSDTFVPKDTPVVTKPITKTPIADKSIEPSRREESINVEQPKPQVPERPALYDPLAPAISAPEPINLNGNTEKPQQPAQGFNAPLPPAEK